MEEVIETGSENPSATSDELATNLKGNDAATQDDGKVVLDQEDYKNLVSQRDRNAEALRLAEENSEAVNQLAKERAIDKFLLKPEVREKYPDVTAEDLEFATSEAELEELAERTQTRIQDAVQNRLKSVQVNERPKLSEEDRTKQINALRNSDDPKAFEKAMELGAFSK